MSNEECIEIAKEFPMDPAEAARGLILEATSRWMKHSDYLDDITCVVLMLDNEQHEPFHIETGDELVMDESTNASVTPSSEAPLTINAQLWTFFAGATSGYLGGLCGIPGPSLILYFLHPPAGVTFTKKSQRATGSSITAINVATRIIYYLVNTLGMKQDANFKNKDWILYVCIALTSLLGILFGSKLFDLLSDNVATIRSILTIFLVLCGVSLLFSSYADV
jgi:Predicted permeases